MTLLPPGTVRELQDWCAGHRPVRMSFGAPNGGDLGDTQISARLYVLPPEVPRRRCAGCGQLIDGQRIEGRLVPSWRVFHLHTERCP